MAPRLRCDGGITPSPICILELTYRYLSSSHTTIPRCVQSVFHPAKCSLCYDLTKSTPGYAADPNNCQNFVMCEAVYAEGAAPDAAPESWNTFNMMCPNCTLWNQDLLTCVQVYYGTEEECGHFTHGPGPTQTTFGTQQFIRGPMPSSITWFRCRHKTRLPLHLNHRIISVDIIVDDFRWKSCFRMLSLSLKTVLHVFLDTLW